MIGTLIPIMMTMITIMTIMRIVLVMIRMRCCILRAWLFFDLGDVAVELVVHVWVLQKNVFVFLARFVSG